MSMFDKEKTITDQAWVKLLTPDAAYKDAWYSTGFATDSMGDFNEMFFMWKKKFRHNFSEDYLRRSDLNPNSPITIAVIDETKILEHIQIMYDDLAKSMLTSKLSIPEIGYVSRFHLQENGYDWNNSTDTLVLGGITYTTFSAYYPNIPDDPFYDPSDEEKKTMYAKITMVFTDGLEEPVDIIEIEIDNTFNGILSLVSIYSVVDEDNPWYVYLEDAETLSTELIIQEEVLMTPIVPIKEDNEFVNNDELKVKRLLNKYGLGGKQLIESLTEDEDGEPIEVDSVYMCSALPFRKFFTDEHKKWREKNGYMAEGLFKSFAYFNEVFTVQDEPIEEPTDEDIIDEIRASNPFFGGRGLQTGSNSLSFDSGDLDTSYGFNYDLVEMSGNANSFVMPGFKYVAKNSDDGFFGTGIGADDDDKRWVPDARIPFELEPGEYYMTLMPDWAYEEDNTINDPSDDDFDPAISSGSIDSQLYLFYQINENKFYKIHITQYAQTLNIAGYSFDSYLDSLTSEGGLLVPFDVMHDLRFRNFVTIHEFSFSLVMYSKEVVTIKWYEQKFFRFLIMVVVAYLTAGAGVSFMQILMQTAIKFAIGMVVSELLSLIDNPALKAALSVVISFMMGGGNLSTLTFENFLPLALNGVSTYIAADNVMKQLEEYELKKQEAIDEKEEDYWAGQSGFTIIPKMDMGAHYSFQDANNPDAFYAEALGEGMYSYEQYYNVDGEIEKRKKVESG